jgi:hypothetical protein
MRDALNNFFIVGFIAKKYGAFQVIYEFMKKNFVMTTKLYKKIP